MTRHLFEPSSIENHDNVSILKHTLDMLKFANIKPYTRNEKGDKYLSNFLPELETIIRSSVPISIKSDPSHLMNYDRTPNPQILSKGRSLSIFLYFRARSAKFLHTNQGR